MRESINFVEVKDNFVFEMDDITPEATVLVGNYLEINIKKHKRYFKESQEVKDETEVSDIPEEDKLRLLQE